MKLKSVLTAKPINSRITVEYNCKTRLSRDEQVKQFTAVVSEVAEALLRDAVPYATVRFPDIKLKR